MKILKITTNYFMMLFMACVFVLGFANMHCVEAADLYTPTNYWNDDKNYPLAFAQNGVSRYVDLSSANIIEQEENVEENSKTTVFAYDVIMVNGDITTKFSYKTMIRFINDEIYIASARANGDGWFQLSDRSFDQPQYNATLILADYFGIDK